MCSPLVDLSLTCLASVFAWQMLCFVFPSACFSTSGKYFNPLDSFLIYTGVYFWAILYSLLGKQFDIKSQVVSYCSMYKAAPHKRRNTTTYCSLKCENCLYPSVLRHPGWEIRVQFYQHFVYSVFMKTVFGPADSHSFFGACCRVYCAKHGHEF